MNVQLPLVVSDITGATGLRILRDIVAGQRDPAHLAQHRDPRCRATQAEIVAALTGHYRPDHLFVLQQNLELFDACQAQIARCDTAIEAHLHTLTAPLARAGGPAPGRAAARRQDAEDITTCAFDVRPAAVSPDGRGGPDTDRWASGRSSALKLISEIGTDMTSLADREAFHLVVDPRAQEQDHRGPARSAPAPSRRPTAPPRCSAWRR